MWHHYDFIMESRASFDLLNLIVEAIHIDCYQDQVYILYGWWDIVTQSRNTFCYISIIFPTPFYQFHKEHPKNTKFWLSITQKPFIEFLWNFCSLLIAMATFVSTAHLLWHVSHHAVFLAQLQWFEGPRLRPSDNTCLPGTWYDILLYHILAARDNLKIVTRVPPSCYCLNLEQCQRQLRNICWLRLLY